MKHKGIKIVGETAKVELPKGIRRETLTFGTMKKDDFAKVFEQRKYHVSPYAQNLTGQIDPAKFTDSPPMELIWPSGRDLGINKSAQYRSFLEAGQAKGYNLVSPEVGLYLRFQDDNQPLNDLYWLAMEPMASLYGPQFVFALAHNHDGMWLDADWAYPGLLWDPEDRLVFSLPASEPQKP